MTKSCWLGLCSTQFDYAVDPVKARERDEDEDEIVERIPNRLKSDVEDIHVRHEISPCKCPDQEEYERDPIKRVLWTHTIVVRFSR